VATNAAAALGRIAGRVRAPATAARALCPLLGDARAQVRSNALTGLASAGARCEGGAAERRLLAEDRSEMVRAAAASLVGRAPTDEDKRALDRCASSDRAGSVAHRCRALPPPPKGTHAVTVYVVTEAAASPKPRAPYALQLADGFVRSGVTDRRGALFEPLAPTGEVTLVRAAGR
jgi:hypothetical protein